MSTIPITRRARRPGPEMPEGDVALQEPPTLPESQADLSAVLTYLPMAVSSAGMLLLVARPGSGPLAYVAGGLMVVSMLAMLIGQMGRTAADRRRTLRGARRDYLRHLARTREQVRAVVARQRTASAWRHPSPGDLWSLVTGPRLWERRPADRDFGEVRVAVGEQRLGVRLVAPTTRPVEDLEPLCAHALRRFVRAYASVPEQPVAVYLPAYRQVLCRGDEEAARALIRSVLAQAAVFHAPHELRIAVCVSQERREHWEWVKWLPHARDHAHGDAAGAVRLVAGSVRGIEDLLGAEFTGRSRFEASAPVDAPYTLIVLDGGEVPAGARLSGSGYRSTTLLAVVGADGGGTGRDVLCLDVASDRVRVVRGAGRGALIGRPDRLSVLGARTLATRLAPYRAGIADAPTARPMASDFDLAALLGIVDPSGHDPGALWERRAASDRLRVPIGVDVDGLPVHLDIKESALGGHGPHGMLIGATGSGKSELLRTLVLGLALTHSSQSLNFVLVDFKGGATFLGLESLPHTSAVITNLADEIAMVARMQDALHGELIRRQELLRSAGNHSNIHEYEKARAGGAPLAPLPTLFVVVDEFSELLATHRDFMDLFIMIGRLGRSLGVHLLLASQRLDEGRMNQLETHLSYRIALRTFSAMESRGVLGAPDAYELPPAPGGGYLKTGMEAPLRFKAAYVSGPVTRGVVAAAPRVRAALVPFTSAGNAYTVEPAPQRPTTTSASGSSAEKVAVESLLDVVVRRLHDSGPKAHRVWLPPLGAPPTLDGLLADAPLGGLCVPVAEVDRPFEQTRAPLTVDLSGAGGHVGVAGGPQSGKSTLLRTLVTALALTHTPREVQFYCLDFGGGTLSGLAGLPHVAGVAGRLDDERVQRTVAEVDEVLARRERCFPEWGVDSMAAFRRLRAAGGAAEESHGDVFLVVDGWTALRQEQSELLPALSRLASRGLSYGVHLILCGPRWSELPPGLRDQLGTRLELRLGDAVESAVDMRAARLVPQSPGRGLTEDRKHFLAALPRIDGVHTATDLSDGVADLVRKVAADWDGPPAPEVRTLPRVLPAADLPAPYDGAPESAHGGMRVALGLEDQRLEPVWHDFGVDPHLIVVGDDESGRTNLLRHLAHAITTRYTPAQARVMTVDFRRRLHDSVPPAYRLGYAVTPDVVGEMIAAAGKAVTDRRPGADLDPERMGLRDWWQGPELYLLVDDYEMVANGLSNPFEALMATLPQGAELGLHVIVARAANGAARSMGDPLIRRMLDGNTPALLLSCPPSEGIVFGSVRPRRLPAGRGLYITRRGAAQVQTALAHSAPAG